VSKERSERRDHGPRLVFAGCAFDTGNLGVNALGHSAIAGLAERLHGVEAVALDHSDGRSRMTLPDRSGASIEVTRAGARLSRRAWEPETWSRLKLHAAVGFGSATAALLRDAAALLDVSGGDSFTDLYGPWRYRSVTEPKRFALKHRVPLIFLPQTYGPFRDERVRSDAASLVGAAEMAWARDERSFEVLKELLGDRFDPTRHRVGVDVAFGLPSHPPAKLPTSFDESGGEPPVGLNVSGLIYNDPNAARERYRFVLDYRELVARFVRWLIEERGARVTLVPHVVPGGDVVESDPRANRAVLKELGDFGGRLSLLPEGFDQCETKWLISRCAWFCGTRMHSTIAGLSSGTRTATVSYSPKALGVFESCGLGEAVVDPTSLSTDEALERLRSIYDDRERLGGVLQERLPAVLATADAQMDEIADAIASKAGLRRKGAAAAGAVEAGSAPA